MLKLLSTRDMAAIFVNKTYEDLLNAALADVEKSIKVFNCDKGATKTQTNYVFIDQVHNVSSDDDCLIAYTSGSTGASKRFCLFT